MRRCLALTYGAGCHLLFLVAVSAMAWSLHRGMQIGFGPFTGATAWVANGLLLLQFPVLHSLALTSHGAQILLRCAPAPLRQYLFSTLFATFSSLQLIVTFLGWSPSGIVWWEASGTLRPSMVAVSAVCWLFLMKTMKDAGLGAQTGFQGWSCAWRGVLTRDQDFPRKGTYRLCRQPIYLAFSMILWLGPVMSPDRLAIAMSWTAYCLVGPLHKEARARRRFGPAFTAWKRTVPYFFPRILRGRVTSSV